MSNLGPRIRAAARDARKPKLTDRKRQFLAGDVHHELQTIAGLLRCYGGDPNAKVSGEQLVEFGDRLSECSDRLRREFGFRQPTDPERCPDCMGGEIITNPDWPSGDLPYSEKCSTCGGSGNAPQ